MMAGINISGDLKDPGRSIPKGTILAVGTSGIVYLTFILLIASTCVPSYLVTIDGYLVMKDVSLVPWLFTLGIMCASLSSAMASIIGAAKTLQALARDDLLPLLAIFKEGSPQTDDPRYGVLFAFGLSSILLLSTSELNLLASYQTQFFLLTYCFVNYACVLLSISGSPNFRPNFQYFSWHLSALGIILGLVVMFLVDSFNALASLVVCFVIFLYIQYCGPRKTWGNLSQALLYHQVRKYLLRLDVRKDHIKYWRPQILLLVANPRSSYHTLQFTNKLKKGGLYIVGNVSVADDDQDTSQAASRVKQQHRAWLDYIEESNLKAFADVVVAPTIRLGIQNLLMTSGLGALRPNTVSIGFYDPSCSPRPSLDYFPDPDRSPRSLKQRSAIDHFPPLRGGESRFPILDYVQVLNDILDFGNHLLVTRNFEKLGLHLCLDEHIAWFTRVWNLFESSASSKKHSSQSIDLWLPAGSHILATNIGFLLSFILSKADLWMGQVYIRILSVADQDVDLTRQRLQQTLYDFRIPCGDLLVLAPDEVLSGEDACLGPIEDQKMARLYNRVIQQYSQQAAVVFIPIARPPLQADSRIANEYLEVLETLSRDLCPTIMMRGQGQVISTDI
jgi:potassium/chloride transporter 9